MEGTNSETCRCNRIHKCIQCGVELSVCQLPTWACPWLNEDEDQLCDPCEEALSTRIEEALKQWEGCDEMVKKDVV